jgi:hypothetical protein
MAIIEHWPVFLGIEESPDRIVVCDRCGAHAPSQPSTDPGESAMAARKVGFTTVKVGLGKPLEWRCPRCKESLEKSPQES